MSYSQTMSFNSFPNDNFDNGNQMYGRQQSSASDLGNVLNGDFANMMETPIDISNYLFDDDNDEPKEMEQQYQQPSEKQLTDQYYNNQVHLQQALYHDIETFHPYDTNSAYGSEYSPNCNYNQNNAAFNASVKSEPEEDEYAHYEREPSPIPSTSRQTPIPRTTRKIDAAKALKEYTPQTKARGYKIKEEDEKADPSYKLKRARNNDAVRKSRTKAKEQQMVRDMELNQMKDRNLYLEKRCKMLENRLAKYEKI